MKEVVVIWRCTGQWLHKDNCYTQKIIITKDYGHTLDKKTNIYKPQSTYKIEWNIEEGSRDKNPWKKEKWESR